MDILIHNARSRQFGAALQMRGRPAVSRRRISMAVAAACLTAVVLLRCCAAIGQARPEEYRVKAAFIFHFAQLVDWPADSQSSHNEFSVCVLGADPFRGALEESMNGKTVHDRPIRVGHLKQPEEIRACQVLFVAAEDAKRLPNLFEDLKTYPVLTVGDGEDFVLQRGGMIGFCLENNQIRFDINLDAADRAHVKISSKLLLLAKVVIGKQEGK